MLANSRFLDQESSNKPATKSWSMREIRFRRTHNRESSVWQMLPWAKTVLLRTFGLFWAPSKPHAILLSAVKLTEIRHLSFQVCTASRGFREWRTLQGRSIGICTQPIKSKQIAVHSHTHLQLSFCTLQVGPKVFCLRLWRLLRAEHPGKAVLP